VTKKVVGVFVLRFRATSANNESSSTGTIVPAEELKSENQRIPAVPQ
jgi:hypothetical protein